MQRRDFIGAMTAMAAASAVDATTAQSAPSRRRAPVIHGRCTKQFEPVREAFERNWTEDDELGAAVCICHQGAVVVDLWGGYKDLARTQPWERHTIVNVASVTKSLTALTVHGLIERNAIDLETPVAHYWPEFAAAGKEKITVRQLISHQAGLIYPDHARPGSLLDWDEMTRALAAQEPVWPPGTPGAYHSSTYGHLLGELIRRATHGQTLPLLFDEYFARPLQLDCFLTVNDEQMKQVSDLHDNPANELARRLTVPDSKAARAWRVMPRIPNFFNSRELRTQELGSGGAQTNGNALARLYGALANGGEIEGVRIMQAGTIERMRQEQWQGICGLTDRPTRMAMGFFLSDDVTHPMGPHPSTFGHGGAGGALGFADVEVDLSFSYTPNFMCEGQAMGWRTKSLVHAAFASLRRSRSESHAFRQRG